MTGGYFCPSYMESSRRLSVKDLVNLSYALQEYKGCDKFIEWLF